MVCGLFEGLISSKFVNHDIKDIGILNRFSDATNYTNNNKQGVKAKTGLFILVCILVEFDSISLSKNVHV